jgi:hypothetical protein
VVASGAQAEAEVAFGKWQSGRGSGRFYRVRATVELWTVEPEGHD